MPSLEFRVAHLERCKPTTVAGGVTPALFARGMRQLGFSAPTPKTGETVTAYIRRLPHAELLDFVRACHGYA